MSNLQANHSCIRAPVYSFGSVRYMRRVGEMKAILKEQKKVAREAAEAEEAAAKAAAQAKAQ